MTAIIFDCDGVLVDSEVLALEIELASLGEIGLEFDPEVYKKQHLGTSAADFFRSLETEHQQKFGRPLPDGFRERVGARYKEAFSTRLQAIPGVHDVLAALTAPLAVASGSSLAGLAIKLDRVALAPFFGPYVYSAQQVTHGKPAPDLFLFAASGLGVDPAKCVVIEDSAKGVRGAVAAGMRAIGFTGGGHCSPDHGDGLMAEGADTVCASMAELATVLR